MRQKNNQERVWCLSCQGKRLQKDKGINCARQSGRPGVAVGLTIEFGNMRLLLTLKRAVAVRGEGGG